MMALEKQVCNMEVRLRKLESTVKVLEQERNQAIQKFKEQEEFEERKDKAMSEIGHDMP